MHEPNYISEDVRKILSRLDNENAAKHKEKSPFEVLEWEKVEPSEESADRTPQIECTIGRSYYQGTILFRTQDQSQAERLLDENGGKLAEAFDQLVVKPDRSPGVAGTDWKFGYDSFNAEPEYKYYLVQGTLKGEVLPVGFIMTKSY